MQTAFLIDGFNVYHSIRELPTCYRWLDYHAYCLRFLRAEDSLHSISYFTALAFWMPESVKRHTIFIEACKVKGVKVILGKFKQKDSLCPKCHQHILRHEEKATDVNVALHAYRLASLGIEQIFLVSGDTDLIPAIRMIRQDFPNTSVGIIFPYKRYTRELGKEADIFHKTTRSALGNCLLPETMKKPNGKIITCPPEWRRR